MINIKQDKSIGYLFSIEKHRNHPAMGPHGGGGSRSSGASSIEPSGVNNWSVSKNESPKELSLRGKENSARKSANKILRDNDPLVSGSKAEKEYDFFRKQEKDLMVERQSLRQDRLINNSSDKTVIPKDHEYSKLGLTVNVASGKLASYVLNENDSFASHGESKGSQWGAKQVWEVADVRGFATAGKTFGEMGKQIMKEAEKIVKREQD